MKNKKLIVDDKEIKDCFTFSIKSNKKNNFDFKETNFKDDINKEVISAILYDDNTFEGIMENDYFNSSLVYGKIMPNGVLSFIKISDKNKSISLNTLIKRENYYGVSIQSCNDDASYEILNEKTSKYVGADIKPIEDRKMKLIKTKEILKLKDKLLKSAKINDRFEYIKKNIDSLTVTGLLELREKLNTRFMVTINSAATTINQKDFDRTDFMYRDLLMNSDIWIPLRDELEFNFLSYIPKGLTDKQKQNVKTLLKK